MHRANRAPGAVMVCYALRANRLPGESNWRHDKIVWLEIGRLIG